MKYYAVKSNNKITVLEVHSYMTDPFLLMNKKKQIINNPTYVVFLQHGVSPFPLSFFQQFQQMHVVVINLDKTFRKLPNGDHTNLIYNLIAVTYDP